MLSQLMNLPGAPFITGAATIIAAIIGLMKASAASAGAASTNNTNVGTGNRITNVYNGGQALTAFLVAALFGILTYVAWPHTTVEGVPTSGATKSATSSSKASSTSEGGGTVDAGEDGGSQNDDDEKATAQNVLNGYYAGYNRTWLNDVDFDKKYFRFPLTWYGKPYDDAKSFARPKQDYVERAKKNNWPKCNYFAAEVDRASETRDGKLIVDTTVTKEPETGCKGAGGTTRTQYLLVPDANAPQGYKIQEVNDLQ